MRADKHLAVCTEECKYNSSGICLFSLRNKIGCFLDPEVKKIAGEMLANALTINTFDRIKEVIRGKI